VSADLCHSLCVGERAAVKKKKNEDSAEDLAYPGNRRQLGPGLNPILTFFKLEENIFVFKTP
jgi:hypothetical protein